MANILSESNTNAIQFRILHGCQIEINATSLSVIILNVKQYDGRAKMSFSFRYDSD